MTDEPRKILVTGFMGAGKTTVAQALARQLGAEYLDLDHFISDRTGATPQELIDREGEMRFREIETLALAAALRESAANVISLGGGTWTIGRNRALIADCGARVIWLDAPFELCWARIAVTGRSRPLARDRGKARRLYEDRLPLYKLADVRAPVGARRRPDRIAAEIIEALRAADGD